MPKRIQDQIEREALITQRALWEVRPQDNVINNFLTRIVAKNNTNNTSTANLNEVDQTRLSVEGLRSRIDFQSQEDSDEIKMRDMPRENYLSNEENNAATQSETKFSSILTKQRIYSDAYSDEEEEDDDNDGGGGGDEWADNQNEDEDDDEKPNSA